MLYHPIWNMQRRDIRDVARLAGKTWEEVAMEKFKADMLVGLPVIFLLMAIYALTT